MGPHPADWLVPDWPAPASVRALCSTRAGGASRAPFDSFNLGDHVGDDPQQVAAHRDQWAKAIEARPVFLQQVHGTRVLPADAGSTNGEIADASISTALGLACTIMVADCLPLLLCTTNGRVVGAAHAGWRGLQAGVIEQTLMSMKAVTPKGRAQGAMDSIAKAGSESADPGDEILAWLGPCIGPGAFEVGPEVRQAFVEAQAAAADCFRPLGRGKFLADLPGLARQRLRTAGVRHIHGNDGSAAWCTVSNPSRFFSHRRDSGPLGSSGRFAASIWRV